MEHKKTRTKCLFSFGILPALLSMLTIGIALSSCHSGSKQEGVGEQAGGDSSKKDERVIAAYYKYFRGTIGERKVVLQLLKYNNRYDGVLIDSLGAPLTATGNKDSSDQLTLISYDRYNPVDTFTGTFPQPGVFQGFWSDTSGRHAPFIFQEAYPSGTYRWQVYTMTDSVAFDTTKQSPKARLQMNLLWPDSKSMDTAQWSLITDTIVKKYLNRDTIIRDASAVLHIAADSFLYNYRQLGQHVGPDNGGRPGATFNWEMDASMSLLWNADSLVSIAFRNYQYTGGAHGLGNTFLAVFDLRQNKVLSLQDIFKPHYKSKLQQVLEDELRKDYDIPADGPLNGKDGILFDKRLALTKNFYLTGSGIGFIYNPYEVAPYVVGQIDLFVPFSKVEDILKNYR